MIFHEEADAVLGVAGCVDTLYRDIAKLEFFVVLWCLSDAFAVFAANNV